MTIHDFEFIKPITRGGFARVYLARKKKTGDMYAIKVMSKAEMIKKVSMLCLSASYDSRIIHYLYQLLQNQVNRVKLEQSILSSIHNPFLVKLYYSFHTRKNLYLVNMNYSAALRNKSIKVKVLQVMEFVRGGDLFSLLESMGALSEEVAKGKCSYLCDLLPT